MFNFRAKKKKKPSGLQRQPMETCMISHTGIKLERSFISACLSLLRVEEREVHAGLRNLSPRHICSSSTSLSSQKGHVKFSSLVPNCLRASERDKGMHDHCGFSSLALGKIQCFTVYHCLLCPLNLSAEILFPLTTEVTNVPLKQRRRKLKSSHVTCPLPLFTYLKFLNSPAASPNSGSSQPCYLENESFPHPLSQPWLADL